MEDPISVERLKSEMIGGVFYRRPMAYFVSWSHQCKSFYRVSGKNSTGFRSNLDLKIKDSFNRRSRTLDT